MDNSNETKILKQSLDTIMSDRFGRYSKYIIQDRALPDARDGLKPVQRRILYAMNDLGLSHNKPFKKSARIVGEVIGKYHPHGDSSIYESMVRMSQDWKMNFPLITMHGNNGSIDDDPAAAMRYTEVRLSKLTAELLKGIKQDTVSFAPNFDDSETEPTVLPAGYPNLLVNGAKGIAAGYATEMPPHNLGEIINGAIALIKSPNIRLETLMKHVHGPDFPTGGIVQGKEGIYSAFERGKGRMIIRSKVEVIDLKTKPSITITEIPYGVVKSKLVREIDEIRFNKSIHGIKEVRDETDRNGISVVIELVPGTDAKLVLNYLYSKTDLQVYYNYNNIAIKDRAPKLLSLVELLEAFIAHQKDVQTNKLKHILHKDSVRHEIVSGLVRVADIVDEVVEVIRRATGSKSGVVKDLMDKFNFTEIQASAIAELRLYRLSSTDQSVYIEEMKNLEMKIAEYKKLLNNNEEFDRYLISQLQVIKKEFATPRRSLIEDEIEEIKVDTEALIKHEDVYVGVTKMGYIKSFSNRAMESNQIADFGMKEGDSLIFLEKINTVSKLIVLTNDGKYTFIPAHKIKDSKFKSIGQHLNDFAAMNPDSSVVATLAVEDFNLNAYVTMVTKKGKAKRVKVSEFEVSRYKKSLVAIKLGLEDELVDAKFTNGQMQVIVISSNAKATKYEETTLPSQGTKSSGVIGISLNDNYVTGIAVANPGEVIALASNRGGLKRLYIDNIQPCSRATKGRPIYRNIISKPHIVTEAFVANTKTEVLFNSPVKSSFKTAGEVDITDLEVGLSSIGPSQLCVPKAFGFDSLNKDSPILEVEIPSDDNVFSNAEKAIDSIDQLAFEDLLKDI